MWLEENSVLHRYRHLCVLIDLLYWVENLEKSELSAKFRKTIGIGRTKKKDTSPIHCGTLKLFTLGLTKGALDVRFIFGIRGS